MTRHLLRTAISLVQVWARLYTAGMPPALSAARRAEIDSDLWELEHDRDRAGLLPSAVQVIVRLLAGIKDDLFWRAEHAPIAQRVAAGRFISMAIAASFLIVLATVPAPFGAFGHEARRTRIDRCASAYPRPSTRAELRMQVMSCAGVFFAERRPRSLLRE